MLDSTFIIDHLRADSGAMRRLEEIYRVGDDPMISSVTTTEAWAGSASDDDPAIERFLRYFEFVHAGPAAASLAGRWRADARRRGFTLSTTDALIAATAFDLDAAVLTRDVRDFGLTPVRIETY